jgi:glycosyltransferase involved in cell wall biosynthesis
VAADGVADVEGSTCGPRRYRFVVAGHLPPPTHGMAVATETFADFLEEASGYSRAEVERWRISADPSRSRMAHHFQRLARVATAVNSLVRGRHDIVGLYVSADAGAGMVYTMALCIAARSCGIPAFVHHHSASYLDANPEMKLKVLCRVAGPLSRHLVGCELTAGRFVQLYGRTNVDVVPICFAIEPPPGDDREERPGAADQLDACLRVGHLSNLSLAKGLVDVFATAGELTRMGEKVTLVVAGPAASEEDDRLLRTLIKAATYNVECLGPVYGRERDGFFAGLDVFLFPSRYRHESFGLVAGEALIRGIPVVAYGCGCLTAGLVGEGGHILSRSSDFPREAATWIQANCGGRGEGATTAAGTQEFLVTCRAARDGAREMARMMLATR